MYKCIILLSIIMSIQVNAESRKRIYVLDTGLSWSYTQAEYICKNIGDVSSTNTPHGDNITSIIGIKINMQKYCVYPVNVFDGTEYNEQKAQKALYKALHDPLAVAINMSLEGPVALPNEFKLIRALTQKGIKVIVAAGNSNLDLKPGDCKAYPACYGMYLKNNFFVVAASDMSEDNRPHFRHYEELGYKRGIIKQMTGTSQACAEFTGGLFR